MMKVDILITTYNDDKYLKKCIQSILNQSHTDFNLIIVDDGSTDNSFNIIKSFKDNRITHHRFDKNSGNISAIRNKSFKFLKSEWIFITDGDCHVHEDWLKKGIHYIKRHPELSGIEGQVIYGNEDYQKTLSDRYIENRTGNRWCMANVAYKRELLLKYSLNENFARQEDRHFALRLIKDNHIIKWVPESIVYHQIKKDTIKWILLKAPMNSVSQIKFYKYFGDESVVKNHIFSPKSLLIIIFPPLLFYSLFFKVKTKKDLIKWLLLYPQLLIQRYFIWKTAFKEKVFAI